MEKCEYEEIFTDSGIEIIENDKSTWRPLLRQCMISMGIWYIYFMQGLYLGAPTVLKAQIRKQNNSSQVITDEMSSWLSSTPVISSLPLMLILPWFFHRIGRKLTYLIVCVISIPGFIIFYAGTELYHVLISQLFLGPSGAAVNSFTPIILAEYTSPKYRGIFLTLKSVSTFWGIWVANVIGTFFYWKNIALVSFLCSVYVVTVTMWPESPYWLAMKGRYTKCAKSHRWLKGVSVDSERELAQLIVSQKRMRLVSDKNVPFSLIRFIDYFKLRSFYKPTLICVILLAQYHFTGKLVISIYAIEVLKNMTQDEAVAYKAMLILDGVTVVSMYLGCIVSRFCRRRVLLFLLSSIGIFTLYVLSLYLYLTSLSLLRESHVIIIVLLSVFSIATGCGPMILSSSIYGEIVPVHYQSTIMVIAGFSTVTIMSTMLKLSPFMFKTFEMHGCFLFFAVCSTVITIILYIHLPETKDKTIHEIGVVFNEKELLEQNKTLVQT